MSGLNYELLKLSRILPNINGKPILDIYKESLDKARKNYEDQLEGKTIQEVPTKKKIAYRNGDESTENIISAWDNERDGSQPNGIVKKSKKLLGGIRSADESPQKDMFDISITDYPNLNKLYNSPTEKGTYNLLKSVKKGGMQIRKPMTSPKKKQHSGENNTADRFFSSKPFMQIHTQNETYGFMRPGTCHTPSNFVFRKKKIVLRTGSENEHNYQYSSTREVVPEDNFGLNGLRLHVEKTTAEELVNEQKQFTRNNKPDTLMTFNDRFSRPSGSIQVTSPSNVPRSPTEDRRVIQTAQASNLLARNISSKGSRQAMNNPVPNNNLLMVDGTLVKTSSAKKMAGFVPLGKAREEY